jgi:hypothetical protein
MKVELSHDALARRIYEKASAEDKMRLKVTNFVRSRYAYYKENRILLKTDDLAYIDPYVESIDLSDAERKFISDSRRAAKWRRLGGSASIAVAFITLAILYAKSEQRKILLQEQKLQLETAMSEVDKARMAVLKSDSIQSLSNDELKRLASELKVLNDSLRTKSDSLRSTLEQVEQLNKKLATKAKTEEKRADAAIVNVQTLKQENEKLNKELSSAKFQKPTVVSGSTAKWQSKVLSAKALMSYKENNQQTAFQLARRAWELDQTNREAAGILKWINSPPDAFGKRAPWAARYDAKEIEAIINRLNSSYGSLSKAEENSILGQ